MPSNAAPNHKQPDAISVRGPLTRRQNIVHILFVNSFIANVERCMLELKRVRFTGSAELVATPEQFVERLNSGLLDLIVAEYPSTDWQGTEILDLLGQSKQDIPLIYLVHGLKRETSADLVLKGAADCIEQSSLSHLPVAVQRALHEKALRDQRDHAEKNLRRSEAHYRALAGNLSYGICRCSADGKFLEVNEALMNMLGYESKDEFIALDLAQYILHDPGTRAQLLGSAEGDSLVDPLEIEWKRKSDGTLKVRLSGREVQNELAQLVAYEVIVEDITRQRQLEDHLRRQAASDSLTGLANYRRLVDVLDSEIKRCSRTNREFAILFFDLDGLKQINDRHGHMIGSQALRRFADVLSCCCRDIDTPARFGGDEFALVLPETNLEAARRVAERICESAASEGTGPTISVSAGMAIYPQDGNTIEGLLKQADSTLYSMKRRRIFEVQYQQTIAGQ